MKIKTFKQFRSINEMNDTPETYVESVLKQLKNKIDKMFEDADVPQDNEMYVQKAKEASKNKDAMNLKDLGVKLESSEISKYSKLYDSLTIKFSDESAMYNLHISIDLKDAIPTDKEADFKEEDIKECFVKFKKYDIDSFEVIGQISKSAEIKDFNEEFLIGLKIELDEKFGDNEEFKIETQ